MTFPFETSSCSDIIMLQFGYLYEEAMTRCLQLGYLYFDAIKACVDSKHFERGRELIDRFSMRQSCEVKL